MTSQFTITGGKQLNGTIISSGSKNAALKMIAAAILTSENIILENVPKIQDVLTLIEIMISMNADITWITPSTLKINCADLNPVNIDQKKVGNLRGSIVLIGPIVARFGQLKIHEPGGCIIGARPIKTHLHALKVLGINSKKEGQYYTFHCPNLIGNKIILDEISVTTTENALMAATLATGQTEIHLAAQEPEIANLIELLNSMGADINGVNTSILKINGQKNLHSGQAKIIPDRIEIGTYAIAIALTNGTGTIKNVIPDHLDNLVNKFDQIGINYRFEDNNLLIASGKNYRSINFDTRPYPGYSTDLQAPMVLFLTQVKGFSQIFETLFEGRLDYIRALVKMGASINIMDKHTILIKGPCQLTGKIIDSPDLRAGATYVLAGLIAKGETIVQKAEIIDRGYENFDEKLISLGADIRRE